MATQMQILGAIDQLRLRVEALERGQHMPPPTEQPSQSKAQQAILDLRLIAGKADNREEVAVARCAGYLREIAEMLEAADAVASTSVMHGSFGDKVAAMRRAFGREG